mgnify:CR=1 FL=1
MSATNPVILTSAISELLEKNIAPTIEHQLNEDSYMLSNIPKNKRSGFKNNTIYLDLRKSRNESIASIAASTTSLPTAGSQKRSQASVNDTYTFGTFQLDMRTLAHAEGNEDSIVNILTEETDGLRRDMAKDLNRQLFGTGTGVLATVASSSTGTLVTVDSTKYVFEGQLLSINGDAVEVASILSDTTFSTTAAVTIVTSESVVKTEGIAEMNGLAIAIASTNATFQGIDATTNNFWKSTVNSTTTTYTTATGLETDMRASKTAVNKYGKISTILTTYELRDGYINLNVTNQRFVDSTELKGGFGMAPTFDGTAVVADFDCQTGVMYFLDWDAISLEYTKPMQFMNSGNGVLVPIPQKTYSEATLYVFGNSLTGNRRKMAKMTGKTI